ncbi:MAG TPA: hypothetical protein VEB66_09125 [Opitutaceae bacterium]|nr:hypothetical protein [Opitutaceae bacterium]
MIRHAFLFVGTFAAGALIALIVRAARHEPHAEPAGDSARREYAPMVANTLAPLAPAAAEGHSGHGTAADAADSGKLVNTVCAICGMDVDPAMPTEKYQGRTIGFGCKMCPPKFRADPDYYGPFYLRNEVIKRG